MENVKTWKLCILTRWTKVMKTLFQNSDHINSWDRKIKDKPFYWILGFWGLKTLIQKICKTWNMFKIMWGTKVMLMVLWFGVYMKELSMELGVWRFFNKEKTFYWILGFWSSKCLIQKIYKTWNMLKIMQWTNLMFMVLWYEGYMQELTLEQEIWRFFDIFLRLNKIKNLQTKVFKVHPALVAWERFNSSISTCSQFLVQVQISDLSIFALF